MGSGHAHHTTGNERALWWAFGLTSLFLIAEVIGGLLAGSLALISDAAHMLTDTAGLAIALAAIRIGKRPADGRRTFGYYRFEILAATFNAVLLFLVAIYIIAEAYRRLRQPPEIDSMTMLVIAGVGLVVNLISMRMLRAGKDSSLNVRGAYLEVWSDMLGSIGVIVGALIIRVTGWSFVDSVIAVAIGLWVLPRTWTLLRESLNVLLEGAPQGLGMAEVAQTIGSIPGVSSVHDLHVWSISSGKVSLTVHVVGDSTLADPFELVRRVRALMAERFEIHHSTVQVEREACEQAAEQHVFDGGTAATGHRH